MNKAEVHKAVHAHTKRLVREMVRYQEQQWAVGNYDPDFSKLLKPADISHKIWA